MKKLSIALLTLGIASQSFAGTCRMNIEDLCYYGGCEPFAEIIKKNNHIVAGPGEQADYFLVEETIETPKKFLGVKGTKYQWAVSLYNTQGKRIKLRKNGSCSTAGLDAILAGSAGDQYGCQPLYHSYEEEHRRILKRVNKLMKNLSCK